MNSKQINETLNCLMSFMQEVFSEFFSAIFAKRHRWMNLKSC